MKNVILIEGAMDEEIDYIANQLSGMKYNELNGYSYFSGKLGKTKVIVLQTCIGETNAAISTTLAIKKFKPCLIINQGTMGSHDKDIHRYDFVVASHIVNTESKIGDEQLDSYYLENYEWKRGEIKISPEILDLANEIKNSKGEIYCGPIASSDTWHKDIKDIENLHNKFGSLGEEMEGFGSLQAAKLFNVPYLFIRVISNNELNNEEYDPDCATHLQKELINFVKG